MKLKIKSKRTILRHMYKNSNVVKKLVDFKRKGKERKKDFRDTFKINIKNNIERQQSKLLSMANEVANYDYKIQRLNAWAISFNPIFKTKHSTSLSNLYTNTISDISLLYAKYKNKEITSKQLSEQLKTKDVLIQSYNREIRSLRGSDYFKSSFINETTNTLLNAIWYVYFDENTGEPNLNGVLYANLDENGKMNVLNHIYDNNIFFQKEFTKNDFIDKMLQKSKEK